MGQVRDPAGLPPAAAPGPRANSRAHSPRYCRSNWPSKSAAPPHPNRPPPLSPPAAPFTFQQPLDDAVDVEFIYIRHRLPTADPPAAAPPAARARDSRLLSHATSTEAVVAAAVATAAAGPPNRPAPCFLLSLHWNHEKNKMAADSLASRGRRTDARGGVQRPGRDFFVSHRTRGRGRGLDPEGAGSERGQGRRRLRVKCGTRILPPNEQGK